MRHFPFCECNTIFYEAVQCIFFIDDVPKKTVEVNLEESSVWDSEEISVLRKVFKQVKEENRKYRVKKRN